MGLGAWGMGMDHGTRVPATLWDWGAGFSQGDGD